MINKFKKFMKIFMNHKNHIYIDRIERHKELLFENRNIENYSPSCMLNSIEVIMKYDKHDVITTDKYRILFKNNDDAKIISELLFELSNSKK